MQACLITACQFNLDGTFEESLIYIIKLVRVVK